MQDVTDSVMIALLPISTSWCRAELPHLTLVYAGERNALPPTTFNELAKDASALAMTNRPLALEVSGADLFGEEDDVEVLTFQTSSQLLAMRHFVERWNKSEHPFTPHVTVGPRQTELIREWPTIIAFDRVYVGWGTDSLTFAM